MGETELLERKAYSPAEAAFALGHSRSWIYSQIDSGAIKSLRVGGARLIPAAVIEQLLAGAN